MMPQPGMPPSPPMGGAGTGAATSPGPMAGAANQGMSKVKVGLEALQAALPMIPMGSELHADVMQAVAKISKHMSEPNGQGGNSIQALMDLMRAAKTGGAQPNMAAMMPGAGAPSPMPPGGGAPPPLGPM